MVLSKILQRYFKMMFIDTDVTIIHINTYIEEN